MTSGLRVCTTGILCVVGLLSADRALPSARAAAGGKDSPKLVGELTDGVKDRPGLFVIIGCDDVEAILRLIRSSRATFHVLDPRPDVVTKTREAMASAGLHGRRALVDRGSLATLPHADNTVDLVLAWRLTLGDLIDTVGQDGRAAPSPDKLSESCLADVKRVLRPEGAAILGMQRPATGANVDLKPQVFKALLTAVLRNERLVSEDAESVWGRLTKPPLDGADDWSHWEHGPDNNPVSTDAVIQAPYMTQWYGEPLYIAMPAITTAAGGRVFIAMGHIAHHEREEPWLNTLLARNGYNGTPLWRRKLPDGYLAHRSAFIATDDVFYMIDMDGEGCLMLDPATGREKGRIRIPDHPGQWKWIAMHDGRLYVLIGENPDPAETTIVRSPFRAWSWGELSPGYYQDRVPWGFGETILAYDIAGKAVTWAHRENAPVDSRAMVIGGGRVHFYAPDARFGCLDASSGKVVWTNGDAKTRKLIEEPGRHLKSTPGFKSTCFCLYTPKALFFEAQTRMNIVAVSHDDGRLLWHRTKTTNNPNMLYVDDRLFVGIGPDGSTLMLDPMTGKTIKDLNFAKRSCARLTATPDSLFCRGMPEGMTRYDRKTGAVLFNGAFRPSCNDGVIGANGLLYVGPWLCDCNLSLMGRIAMCSAGNFAFDRPATDADRLETFASDASRVAPLEVGENDWPTYRANLDRSASTKVPTPKYVTRLWQSADRLRLATPATAAGGLLFVCDADGRVTAIDAATGKTHWVALTSGRILQPPTISGGRAYVGSGDGCVYAFEAATGRRLWRFRAAPVERRIMVYGDLCSTWPVNTGVLVKGGVAYAAAGIIDYDGTYVCALDAVTGKLKWQNNSSGHLDKTLRKGVSAQGDLTIYRDKLWMPGGNVIAHGVYDLTDGKYCGTDPSNGSPRANRGEEIGVFDKNILISGGRLRYSARENVVNPGNFVVTSPKYKDFWPQLCSGKIPPTWDDQRIAFVDGRGRMPQMVDADQFHKWMTEQHEVWKRGKRPEGLPRATWHARPLSRTDTVSLVMTPNALLAVVEAPIQRRLAKVWRLVAMDRADGKELWQKDLSGPALPGGLLVDRDGRIIVVLADGRIECYGKPNLI
ncbi:MAG: PQQ-binding-like beta-propeller repeat protein [Phycisphaerae bacterium]|nr:PQQ-binding-like beta-propeller repeat protein [Phycisphaerae bacterium]